VYRKQNNHVNQYFYRFVSTKGSSTYYKPDSNNVISRWYLTQLELKYSINSQMKTMEKFRSKLMYSFLLTPVNRYSTSSFSINCAKPNTTCPVNDFIGLGKRYLPFAKHPLRGNGLTPGAIAAWHTFCVHSSVSLQPLQSSIVRAFHALLQSLISFTHSIVLRLILFVLACAPTSVGFCHAICRIGKTHARTQAEPHLHFIT